MQQIDKPLAACRRQDLADVLRVAGRAAIRAGAIIRERYGKPHQIRHKGEIDLVTEADLASEQAIVEILRQERPGDGILAEESHGNLDMMPAGPTWIIDPLDGTTNFAHGFPWFAVSIGYAEAGRTLAGVIYHVMADELFAASLEGGAWLNNEPIRVSPVTALRASLLATGFPYTIHRDNAREMAALARLVTRAQDIRRAGAAALDLAYVACGRLDGYWEMGLKPWDTAAGWLLVEEAGGRVSTFGGGAYSPFVKEVLASNGAIHEQLVALLSEYGEGA